MARPRKNPDRPKNCRCSMRDNEHDVTCPANPGRLASVDESIDDDPCAPDLVGVSTNGHARFVRGTVVDDPDDEDATGDPDESDAEPVVADDQADLAGENVIRAATVDGREARIDARSASPRSPDFEPEFGDVMGAFDKACDALEEAIEDTKAAKERQKAAQGAVDFLRNKVRRAWRERRQMAFPFTEPADESAVRLCSACGEREARVPVANGGAWCVLCVQTALAEPRADSLPDARSPELSLVIEALSAALRAEGSTTTDRAADAVDALAGDTRDLGQIRADLAEIAEAYAFVLSVDPPYVTKAVREEFAPA